VVSVIWSYTGLLADQIAQRNGGNVVVHTRILVKGTVTIEKDVPAFNQIDE